MGKNIDKTFIQSKMLNESKGPAVHSLRAQAISRNTAVRCERPGEYRASDHTPGRGFGAICEDGQIKGLRPSQGPYITQKRLYCVQELTCVQDVSTGM